MQGDELNKNGEVKVQKFPKLKAKLVDGSSLAVAVVLHSIIPQAQGVTVCQVAMRGQMTTVAYYVAHALCQKGVQVISHLLCSTF